jgi:drug/metabolite transporter (DMT)-like permease
VLWAGSYTAGKAALDDVPFVTLNALRFTIAAAVLAPLLWRNRGALPHDRAGVLRLVGIAAFGFCGNKALEFLGLSLTTATDTALLITSESLVTLLLAVLVLGERLRPRTAIAIAVGALGVYVLVEQGLVSPHPLSGDQARGDLLVVLSLALESVATICGAALMRRGSPFTVTAAAITLSLVVWLPAEAAWSVHAGAPRLSVSGWLGVLYLALVATCIAYGGWFWGLQRLTPQDITPLLLTQPVAGSIIAAAVRGERPTATTFAGGALVLGGVALVALRRRPTGAEAELQAMAPEAP